MHRELSVQVGRLEEVTEREARKSREEAKKLGEEAQKSMTELRNAVEGSRLSVVQEVSALKAKLGELAITIADLKKGTQAAGFGAVADLEVRAVGENQYRVSAKQFSEHSFELKRLISRSALAPHFEGEKRVGLRVVEVNSLLERFGVLPGDVIRSVGGLALVSADQIKDVIKLVAKAKEVGVELTRAGQKLTYKIFVAD